MREILFKAKRIDNGEWVEGYYVKRAMRAVDEHGCLLPIYSHRIYRTDEGRQSFYAVDLETVCQYTGLTDKNGVKIFEGDVINVKTSAYAFESVFVKWCQEDSAWCFCCENGNHFRMLDSFRYEVIGNIHDKKECKK